MAGGGSAKRSKSLHQTPDSETLSRRVAIRRVGDWVIYVGALGAGIAACGRTPLGDPFGAGDDDDTGTTAVPSPSPSPTPPPCADCNVTSGSGTGLNRTDLPLNSVAYHSALQIFVCHDASGYYAMTAICPHASSLIPDTLFANGCSEHFRTNDLSFGFCCGAHGSRFDGNGLRVAGPALAGSQLLHFRLSIDTNGAIFVDKTPPFSDPSCRCV